MKTWRFIRSAVILLLALNVSSAYALIMEPPWGEPWVLTATQKTILCSSLERMNMLSLAAKQHDKEAAHQTLVQGVSNGEIEVIPAGTEVYFVKRTSRKVIQVRPKGLNKVYYTASDAFNEGRSAKGENK